jgi:hypothetical protein
LGNIGATKRALPTTAFRACEQGLAFGWVDAYGPGPFEVIRVVEKVSQGILPGVIVKTRLGLREINQLWLAPG